MTKVAQRLEKDGLVRLASRVTDGRITDVFITETGAETATQIRTVAGRIYQQAFDGLSAKEVELMLSVLRRLLVNLKGSA